MEFLKFALICVIFAVVILVVKNQEKEIGLLLSIACSLVLIASIFDSAVAVIYQLEEIFFSANVSSALLSSMLKIIGIAYIAEFAGNICEESGSGTIASKVRLFGKITVLSQTLPLISEFVTIMGGLL